MTDKLTLDWIISTLKKSGCNSKQMVIDRLEKADNEELFGLAFDIENIVFENYKNSKKGEGKRK